LGRKPLLQKPSFCRSGFSRDPYVIENQGFGVYRSGFHCDPCAIENEGSGRKIAALPLGGSEMGSGNRFRPGAGPSACLPGVRGRRRKSRWYPGRP
jgi:hypothetical protein